jgi:hypothetical protein
MASFLKMNLFLFLFFCGMPLKCYCHYLPLGFHYVWLHYIKWVGQWFTYDTYVSQPAMSKLFTYHLFAIDVCNLVENIVSSSLQFGDLQQQLSPCLFLFLSFMHLWFISSSTINLLRLLAPPTLCITIFS